MRFLKIWLIVGIILTALIAGIVSFFVSDKATDDQNNGLKYKEFKIERGIFQVVVSANGIVKPIDRIEIKSKASGQIEELPIEEGDLVQRGELIARLDQKDERAEVAQTQAYLDIAKAELKQAQSMFDRRNQLFQDNLISEEEQDQIELSLASARGKLVQATTALERAKERLNESIVRAPINGIILQKYVEKGQIIASGVSNVGGGTPIVDIADMSSVYIETGIDEIDIGKIQVGQPAVVVAEAYPELKFNGTIVRIAPEAKIEQNVTLFNVIVEVGNTDGKLKSGMNTDITISIVNRENVLLIPTIAIQALTEAEAQLNERVVLLKQENEFVPHKVKIGLSNFKQTEILSGLTEGRILGVPMTSRLKEENERLEERIRSSRSFGVVKQQKTR
jgi:HlyD family secretion protein